MSSEKNISDSFLQSQNSSKCHCRYCSYFIRAVNCLEKIGDDFDIDEFKNLKICKIVALLTGIETHSKSELNQNELNRRS